METIKVWTTKGWVEYLDIAFSDYSGGTVAESNVDAIKAEAEEREFEMDGSYHLSNLELDTNCLKGADGSPYFEPRAIPDGDAVVVSYYGSFSTSGVLVRMDHEYGQEIASRLESYPLLDEEEHSRLEEEKMREAWDNASLRDRMHYLKHGIERGAVSYLAVRHDWDQFWSRSGYRDDQGALRDALLSY